MDNSKNSQHQLLYSNLKASIFSNELKDNDWLPSENELCLQYNISRPTVRIALSRLEYEGFIQKIHGKGSKVFLKKTALGILSVSGTSEGISQDLGLKSHILSRPTLKKWPPKFTFTVDDYLQKGIGAIHMQRERKLGEQTIFLEDTYIPNIDLPDFVNIDFENKSLFKTLSEQYGITIKGGNQRFKSKAANQYEANILQIAGEEAILYIEREIFTNKTDFKLYSFLYCNTANYFIEGSF